MSAISASVAKQLNLKVIDLQKVTGISGSITAKSYDITVTLPNKAVFPLVNVVEWDGSRQYDMLIGMDVISRGDFHVVHKTGKTVFSFYV